MSRQGKARSFGNDTRSATTTAKSDVMGLVLIRERNEALSEQDPFLAKQFLRKMNRLLALKLRIVSKDYAEVKPDQPLKLRQFPQLRRVITP